MRTDPNCVFCKIVAGQIPCFKLYEDDLTIAFMDINPGNPGHCLAIAKEHWEDVFTIPAPLIGAVATTAKRCAEGVQAALSPDGINLVQANGKGAEQSVPHFHMHILPRRVGDELKMNWGHKAGDMEAIKATFATIRARMDVVEADRGTQ